MRDRLCGRKPFPVLCLLITANVGTLQEARRALKAPCRTHPESSPGKRLRHLVTNLDLRCKKQLNLTPAQRPLAVPGLSLGATLT